MKRSSPCSFVFLALLLLPLSAAAQDLNAAAQAYEESLRCKSLYRRALGMEAFAKTRDPRAFKVLSKRYGQPEEPGLHVRYLLASVMGEALRSGGSPQSEAVLEGLLKKSKKPVDGWLARCLFGAQAGSSAAALRKVAGDKRAKAHVRAAAVLALGEAKDPELLGAIPALLDSKSLPKKDRALFVEACARALSAFSASGRDALRPAAEAVIGQLDAKHTTERSKLVISRLLQRALGAARPVFDAEAWRGVLAGGPEGAPGADATRVRPRFFSVQATGRNVAYVIDLSDSMLEPLGEAEVEKLKLAMPKVAETGAFARNRFEATKLVLTHSLQQLAPSMSFAIVGFGSTAELITPGMLQATSANVQKAIRLVNAIPVGDPGPDRPHGTLKGWTNLYGGLRLAFKVNEKGARQADDEYVDEDCIEQGCDTIFLLSDGEPTWSDFEGWDLALPDDVVGDGEGGGASTAAEGEEIQYYGPHFLNRFLHSDLRRLNTYRNVQIHSIGIGEADPEILQQIAEIGLGSAKLFGAGE